MNRVPELSEQARELLKLAPMNKMLLDIEFPEEKRLETRVAIDIKTNPTVDKSKAIGPAQPR